MKPITLKVITLEDVETIFKNRTDMIFDIVIDAFKKYINGDVLLPDKISQIFDNSTQNRINCMPATLFSEAVSGLKWVSVFPTNVSPPYSAPRPSGRRCSHPYKHTGLCCFRRWTGR